MNKNRFGALLVTMAMMAVSMLALLLVEEPAQAAFPGENGKITFVRDGDIWAMNPDGTEQTNLTNSPGEPDYAPAFSPDGERVAFSREEADGSPAAIFVMDADGSEVTRLAPGTAPAFSPDGENIAYTVRNQYGTASDIYVMNTDGSEQTQLTDGSKRAFDPAFSPDGTKIAYVGDETGTLGYVSNIFVADADGSEPTKLITREESSPQGYSDPEWSPDGSRIAFAHTSAGGPNIYLSIDVMNADGSGQTNVTGGYGNGYLAFSPDGQKIVFSSGCGHWCSEYEVGVYTVNSDGTGKEQILAGGRSYVGDWGVAPGSAAPPPPPPPVTALNDSGPAEGSTTADGSAAFEFSSDKEGSTFECSLDEAAFEECSSPEEVTGLSEGGHTFRVRATDTADRTDLTLARRAWTVDTTNPRIFNLSPKPRSSIGKTDPIVRATVRDNLTDLSEADVRLFVNGKEVPETEFSYNQEEDLLKYQPPKLSKGKNKIRVVANDAAGNIGNESWSLTVR